MCDHIYPHEPPRLRTADEERADWIAGYAGMRERIPRDADEVEAEVAETLPKLRAFLATLNPALW